MIRVRAIREPRVAREVVLRVGADIIMVNAALVFALLIRYLSTIGDGAQPMLAAATLREYIHDYITCFGALTAISIAVFTLSSFYTSGRTYRGRYKALIIVRAVTLAYLIFAFVVYLAGHELVIPRTVVPIAWGVTLAFVAGSRLWATAWSAMIRAEWRAGP